jgi:hypothetical protein
LIRAAVHLHTDWSYDGSWELEALAAELGRRGYQALLTAEHDRGFDQDRWRRYRDACAEAAAATGVAIFPGIEYSDPDNVVHVPVWGAADLPFLGEGRDSESLIDAAADAGAVAVLAHPARREAWRRLSPRSFAALGGVEVWNRKYDGWAPGAVARELATEHELTPFFGLDFHTSRQFFPLAMGVEVEGDPRIDDLVGALREGRLKPLAFGGDGARLLAGPGRGAARAAEGVRRAARPAVRKVRRLGVSGGRATGGRAN